MISASDINEYLVQKNTLMQYVHLIKRTKQAGPLWKQAECKKLKLNSARQIFLLLILKGAKHHCLILLSY